MVPTHFFNYHISPFALFRPPTYILFIINTYEFSRQKVYPFPCVEHITFLSIHFFSHGSFDYFTVLAVVEMIGRMLLYIDDLRTNLFNFFLRNYSLSILNRIFIYTDDPFVPINILAFDSDICNLIFRSTTI